MDNTGETDAKWNITGSRNFIAGSQQHFTQNNESIGGFNAEDVLKVVELIRRNAEMLELPESRFDELIHDVELLESEAASSNPDEGNIRAIGGRVSGVLAAASAHPVVQQMLLSAFERGMGGMLG
ncbi:MULTISPECIES: hypothetical protein [unclassified Streptomyces]|uniref:hypothetical protein n=1 Tax=unclassified Streptomyces TaxID=2593676 RepID=UPI002254A394|nr:hypothetical protein [Streptomyces sp. NBC_01285]MCX4773779.1 hypothetical protein [Streptomyces sp. NBC_01285]